MVRHSVFMNGPEVFYPISQDRLPKIIIRAARLGMFRLGPDHDRLFRLALDVF